jgi:enoyl-CoA hydratase/carnithine racemase
MATEQRVGTDQRVRVEAGDGVAEVRLVRAAKHNALDWAMFVALNEAIDQLREARGLRVVVLYGEGPSFCSGLDFPSFISSDAGFEEGFARREGEPANFAQRTTYGWRALPVPVIAALQGACFGGGLQLALAADVRIAAPDTRLSVMETDFGLIPDMGLTQTLPGLVRDDVARELTYSGRVVEAVEAAELGLLTRIDGDPLGAARRLAAEIAARSPDAIRAAKRLLGEAPRLPTVEGLALEADLQRRLIGSANQIAAVSAALGSEPAVFEDPEPST